jgi:hypothetical protein
MFSGPLHLKLNCFVLGDDPRRTSEIKIAPTETVSALRKVIKDVKKQRLDHVNADDRIILKVRINPTDLHLLGAIRDEGVESKPLTELSEVFADEVERGCIHVVYNVVPLHDTFQLLIDDSLILTRAQVLRQLV